LNPAQQEVLDSLRAVPADRPTFDPALRHELRAELEDRLGGIPARLPGEETLFVSKHALSSVHGCEGHHLADAEVPFAWSAATAKGSVAHKAIELSVHWTGEATPLGLVDEAMARLSQTDASLGDWMQRSGPGELAELRSEANDRVAKFLECFPPLDARWRPVPESKLRAELCGERIVLSGKVDLTVGRADGTTAGKVLIDLKTGGFVPAHRDDLRFYALIETLRLGIPPRRVGTYYLDSGRLHTEDVTIDVLESAVERTVRGVEAIVELRHDGRSPVLRPGTPCRWCPALETCDTGRAHLAEVDDID
jgi:hypothetical protein